MSGSPVARRQLPKLGACQEQVVVDGQIAFEGQPGCQSQTRDAAGILGASVSDLARQHVTHCATVILGLIEHEQSGARQAFQNRPGDRADVPRAAVIHDDDCQRFLAGPR